MKVLIQRVSTANVVVNGKIIGKIGKGLVVFLGIKDSDNKKHAHDLALKIAQLRVMADINGKMNLSVKDAKGAILVISQFTLYANTSKGNRPSFITAAKPEIAKQLYQGFIQNLKDQGLKVQTGQFGGYMQVEVVNDGPVTIMLEN